MTGRIKHAAVLALAIGAIALSGVILFAVVPIRSDISVLMADEPDSHLSSLMSALNDGPANRVILIGLEPAGSGDPPETPDALSHAVKRALVESGRFRSVLNGALGSTSRTLQPFFDNRYRLNPPLDLHSFSRTGLEAAFDKLLERLRGLESAMVKRFMAADPTLRTFDVAQLWASSRVGTLRNGVWMDADGRRVLLIAATEAPGYDLATQEENIAAIRDAVRQVGTRFGPQKLILSGAPVIAVESKRLAQSESRRLVVWSGVLVVGFLILAFRRLSFLPAVLLPISFGFFAGMAVVGVIFGHIHVTTLGFGAVLIGIAVDYPLHLMGHTQPDRSPLTAARLIAPALILGVMTSAIGFIPLALSTFPGVAQLGVFTVTGLLAAAGLTRWGLPHVLSAVASSPGKELRYLRDTVDSVARRGRLPAAAGGIVALAYLLSLGDVLWTTDLSTLSPIPERSRENDRVLRADLDTASPRYLIVVSGDNEEAVLRQSEAIEPLLEAAVADGSLSGFDMAARYLPSRQRQAAMLRALPDAATLGDRVARALAGRPFRPGTFAAFVKDVAEAKAEGPVSVGGLEGDFLTARIDGLLRRDGTGGVQGLVLLHGAESRSTVPAALRAPEREGVRFFDLKQETQRLLVDYRGETVLWAAIGAMLAIAVLVVALRNLRAVAAVVLPVVISLTVAAALTAAFAGGLSLFNILALMIVAGLGIDYAVFLRRAENAGPEEQNSRQNALYTVFICMVTSLIVFSLMATAAVPILGQIGLPVAIGSPLCFALALVFLDRRTGTTT